jgi:hypothetical protein
MHAHERKSASAQTADIPQQLSEVREVPIPEVAAAFDHFVGELLSVSGVCQVGSDSSFGIFGSAMRARHQGTMEILSRWISRYKDGRQCPW